jgi:N-acetylneuraminic acid mutarotase
MTELPDVHHADRLWAQRAAVVGSFAAAVVAFVVIVVATLHHDTPGLGSSPIAALHIHRLGDLNVAVHGAAGAPLPSGFGMLVIGGLDQANVPVNAVQQLAGAKATSLATLPTAVRGAAAVRVGKTAYLIGGVGSPAGGTAILSLPATTGAAKQVAALPRPVADSVACVVDGVAYLFGGFTGQQPTATVFAWQPGGAPHPTAHLPSRLLYDAAVAVGHRVIILGGTVNGAPTRAILRFDPIAHRVTTIGRLPVPVSHAVAGLIGGNVFVIGGRVSGPTSQTRAIYQVDPNTGRTTYAGALPLGLSDAAIAAADGKLVVAGGIDRTGQVQRSVYEISVS